MCAWIKFMQQRSVSEDVERQWTSHLRNAHRQLCNGIKEGAPEGKKGKEGPMALTLDEYEGRRRSPSPSCARPAPEDGRRDAEHRDVTRKIKDKIATSASSQPKQRAVEKMTGKGARSRDEYRNCEDRGPIRLLCRVKSFMLRWNFGRIFKITS